MDLFIVRERMKLVLWFVGAGFFIGGFATWHAWRQIGIAGEGREQFLLSATITGALALAWIVLASLFWFTKRDLDPRRNRPDRLVSVPWWILACVGLSILIAAMAVFYRDYSERVESEFSLLQRGELARLEQRLAEHPDRLARTDKKSGQTLLERALAGGNAAAVDLLLSNGADMSSETDRLNLVATLANPPMLEALLRHGANPDAPDADGVALMHYAVTAGNTNALAVLLAAGADTGVRDPLYQTPLLLAVMADNLPMAGTLLEHGADPNASDKRGDTALHLAVRRRNIEGVRFLLEKGADPRVFNFTDMCPIHVAARSGQDDMVELFLEQPGMAGLHNEKGLAPLDHALRERRYDTARLLLRNGAEIDRITANGYTALHLMVVAKDYQTVEFLIGEGASVDIPNNDGETARDLMRKKQLKSLLDLVEARDHPPEPAATNAVESIAAPVGAGIH